MGDSSLPPMVVACPKCGEKLGVRAGDVGKRGQCRQCGATFRIGGKGPPGDAKPREAAADSAQPPAAVAPRTVTFPCELCETRITAAVANVGKAVKCPDCGRRNVIPAPVARRLAVAPAALSGEQFGVWGVDEAPSVAEIAARTPMLHPVVCELCQTLMYATDAQVGAKLKCPDCGTLTTARQRAPAPPRGPVIVPEGDEYQLDEASAPTPRPMYRPIELRGRSEEFVEERGPRSEAGSSGVGGELREGPRRAVGPRLGEREPVEPPKLPAVPLVQGVWRMLLASEVLARWAMLSLSLTLAGWFISWVLGAMSGAVFLAIPMFAIGCVFTGLWLLAAMPLCLAIVTESSEGNDRLHDPPSWVSMDFGEAFFVVIAAALSACPAGLTLKVTGALTEPAQLAIAAGVWLVLFPIVLLSNLEQSSALAVFSPRLLASLVRCAGPWLLFYVESAMLAAAAGGAIYAIGGGPWQLLYLAPWVCVAALLAYMRLIGRLAWWLAETMPAADEAAAG